MPWLLSGRVQASRRGNRVVYRLGRGLGISVVIVLPGVVCAATVGLVRSVFGEFVVVWVVWSLDTSYHVAR